MVLSVQLLGCFGASVDGRPIEFQTRKTAALLAILARRAGRAESRERIAALLWSRSDEAQARTSLRQAVASLRRSLGSEADLIVATNETLKLAADGVAVDADRLEAALTSAEPAGLADAAALYVGDLFDDLALREDGWEEWRRGEAGPLRARTLAALTRLVEAQAAAGDDEAAIATGERVLAIEPTQEEVHRTLMALYLRRDSLGSAMRQFERCRAALDQGLGVRPSAATQSLRQKIAVPRPPSNATPDALPTVAVLPFANLSENAADGYAALGFAEDLIAALSRFRVLRVIARHSSFFPFGHDHTPAELGRRLGARWIVAGSVRRLPGSIRVGIELIDAESGHYAWAHRYDLSADALFEGLGDIVRNVVGALAPRIDEAILASVRRKPLADLSVYDCWLRALDGLRRGTLEAHAEARVYLERALERDPEFGRAYSGMSMTYFNEWSCHAWDRWEETASEAQRWAEEAVRRDEADHMTHAILGRVLMYRRDFARAEHHAARAAALNPNDADMLVQDAVLHAALGDAQRGIGEARTALALNPFHEDWYFVYAAYPPFMAREYQSSLDYAGRAPDAGTHVRAFLAVALTRLGRHAEAERMRTLFMGNFRRNITYGRTPEPEEPVRWLLRTNPMRRPEDRAFVVDGLARAGFVVPADPDVMEA
jgi:DNA-binding SARP family transcriptional activator